MKLHMKKKFDWYFEPSKDEIDNIWKNGILTVDTNVLLDLYRYHEGTRKSIIESLSKFEGKRWLSHQAATEFFRNRTKVIVSSEKAFKQALEETVKLDSSLVSAVNQLKGNRIIPTSVADELETSVKDLIEQAKTKILKAKESYPQFLRDDTILTQLSNLFNDAIGDDFPEGEKPEIKIQAEERKSNKVPPGYLDDDKDGERPYGDYYLWRQILEYAKIERKPVVFVTSERKEDWWEIISGKTIGPRSELMKEANLISGQRVLIYHTELFLKYALERLKQPINEKAIEEIRAVSAWRAEQEIAVKLTEQLVTECTSERNSGTLQVDLKRSVRNFTVSGHLDPRMQDIPQLNVRLISAPESLPKHRIRAGTGTTHDFNIHILTDEFGIYLPVGSYTFGYKAECDVLNEEGEHGLSQER